MGIRLDSIIVENFKSYGERTQIPVSGLSVLMGANSSGKSTALQTLLAVKQTIECNSPDIDLLLSGKYTMLGNFEDAIHNAEKGCFSFGMSVAGEQNRENYDGNDCVEVTWKFSESAEKNCRLEYIILKVQNETVKLVYSDHHIFQIQVNGRKTALAVGINNLLAKKFYIKYNKELNDIFYDFLFALNKWVFPQKKRSFFEKGEMVSVSTVRKFYLDLVSGIYAHGVKLDSVDRQQRNEELAHRVKTDIERFAQYQFEYALNFGSAPVIFEENILLQHITTHEDIDGLEAILQQYEKLLDEIAENNLYREQDCVQEYRIESLYRLGGGGKNQNAECDLISDLFRLYREMIDGIINKVFYVGPIREKPQGLYNVGFESIPKYVGATGAYFASVLLRENKEKEYILPNGGYEEMSLLDALDEWAAHLNVASEIKVEKTNSFGFSVSVLNTQRKKSDIMNVGIGTSQVLPVLITGLLSERGEYLLFEQPELHLHPYSQSRLADFFVELVKRGRKVIVETHSEYFVLRMRYQVLMERIDSDDIVINFFQNKGGTRLSHGTLTGYGNLQYPEDFYDETQRLLDDLMHAALMKRERNERTDRS